MALMIQYWLLPPEHDMRTDFSIRNFHVFTLDHQQYLEQWVAGEHEDNYPGNQNFLIIKAWTTIDEFDSLMEGVLNLRPELLAVLGLLTFVTGEIFSVFQASGSKSNVIDNPPEPVDQPILFTADVDMSEELQAMVNFITLASERKQETIFSLFDRYRKAQSMLTESSESQLYFDESFLAFFHIIELLATEHEDELKANIRTDIQNFVHTLLQNTYQYGSIKLSNEENSKRRLIEQLFIPELPISVKISHLFNKLGLFSNKTRQLTEEYVKLRNDLAHGRAVFNKKMKWPLPPFFRQSQNVAEEIYTIALLSAVTIDAFIGSNIYRGTWEEYMVNYPPPLEDVREFIFNKRYENLSTKHFRSARILNVAPWVLTHYLLTGKIKIESYELALSEFMLKIPLNRRNIIQFLQAAIILSDSNNEALQNKCRSIVQTAFELKNANLNRPRDYYKDFAFHNINLIWFKQYLLNGK